MVLQLSGGGWPMSQAQPEATRAIHSFHIPKAKSLYEAAADPEFHS
jgi:hypothetical protein